MAAQPQPGPVSVPDASKFATKPGGKVRNEP
jgi:hypothetical protein